VTKLRAGRPRNLGSIPRRGKRFFYSTWSRPTLGTIQPPIQWVLGGWYPRSKTAGAWSWHRSSLKQKRMQIFQILYFKYFLFSFFALHIGPSIKKWKLVTFVWLNQLKIRAHYIPTTRLINHVSQTECAPVRLSTCFPGGGGERIYHTVPSIRPTYQGQFSM
jgi:hypothetical protein